MKIVESTEKHKETISKEYHTEWFCKDIWDLGDLGLTGSVTERLITINFYNINQNWLKELAKKYIKNCAINSSASKIAQALSSLKSFSNFLNTCSVNTKPSDINRSLIENYFHCAKMLSKK